MGQMAAMAGVVTGALALLVMGSTPSQALISTAHSSQLFILPLTHQNFSFESPGVSYMPSLLNMPDLPSWLHYSYSPANTTGFVYGVPPEGLEDFQVEVVAKDKETYETAHRVFRFDVQQQPRKPFEVRFKIKNKNVEELLVEGRFELYNIIYRDLWNHSAHDLTMTSLTSAPQRGDRLPASPDEKEGVYVSYGSSVPFSPALLLLEKEVEPLWQHNPCPPYFKKTSYERFFSQPGFAIDWCSFKLYNNTKESERLRQNMMVKEPDFKSPVISALENEERAYLLRRDEVEKRSYTFDVVHTILVPLVVMLVLLGLLTLAMCCHRTNMDQRSSDFFDELFDDFPRLPKGQDIQMVQYASFHRATEALRSLKGREHSPHPSTATTTTQVDTLTRSRTASPSSTLPRNSTLGSRRFEDYATLSRPDPPPYQRNGTTPTR